jgi:hypothetical protein
MEANGKFRASAALPRGKLPRYTLDRLRGPQNRCAHYEEERNILHLSGIEPQFLSRPAHSLVAIPTEIFRLVWQIIVPLGELLQWCWCVGLTWGRVATHCGFLQNTKREILKEMRVSLTLCPGPSPTVSLPRHVGSEFVYIRWISGLKYFYSHGLRFRNGNACLR